MVLITFLLNRQTGVPTSSPTKLKSIEIVEKMNHRRRQKRFKKNIKWFKSDHSLLLSFQTTLENQGDATTQKGRSR